MENIETDIKKPESKIYMKIGRLVIILVAISGMVWLVNRFVIRSKAALDVATVVFSPRTHYLTAGEQFSQAIRLSAGEKKISAIDLVINYNPEFVEYVPQAETQMLNSSIPAQYFTNRIIEKAESAENGLNRVRVVLVASKAETDLLSNLVFSLNFKVIKASTTVRSLILNEPQSLIVGTTGTLEESNHQFDIDSSQAAANLYISEAKSCTTDIQCGANGNCTSDAICKCQTGFYNCDNNWDNGCESTQACSSVSGGVKLQLLLKLQGINNTPVTAPKLKFKLTLAGSGDNRQLIEEIELTASSANNGLYEGTVLFDKIKPEGSFKLLVKGPKHIQKRFCHTQPTGGTAYRCTSQEGFTVIDGVNVLDLSQVPLLTGDVPIPEQDGFLNSKDVAALKSCIQARTTTCINQTDLNYDGATNGTDFTIILNSMAIKYDDEN